MNFKNLFTALVVLFFVYGKVNSQTVSPWRIHEGNEGVVQFMNAFNGDPRAYDKMKIPAKDDTGWKDAPKDANGNVYLDRSSTLRCLQELDFTYFETTVNIPANMTVNEFKVSYDKADDGARIYFFNSKFPGGTFDPTADLIISQGRDNTGSVNLKDKIAAGDNRVVIVQFDDCADRNSVHNIKIAVNGKQITPEVVKTASAAVKPAPAVALKSDPKGGVTIYEHINFGGRTCSFGVGTYDITATEYNDIISSIKVMSGWKVTIYEHWQTTGANVEITSDVADLNSVKFNDIMSGLVVERVSASSAGGVSVAKGKQCKASSVAYGGVASRACDGNTNGAFGLGSCTHTNDENDPWWEVDLGSIYDVSKITIWNRTDECCWNRLQGFYVMCSETAITSNSTASEWQYKGGSCSFSSASQTSLSLDGNKRCRYVRICIPGSMKVLSLAEVEVFGQVSKNQTATAITTASSSKTSVGGGSNLCVGKQCKASSVAYGGVASRACDGNTNGVFGQNSCTHTNDENDPWWEVDLGSIYDVSKITIWNRTDECCWNRLQGFYVMCSETAITSNSTASEWQYKGGSCSFSIASQTNLSLDGNKRCRYVRICIPGSMKVLSLAEVEVFGQLAKDQTVKANTAAAATSLPDKFKVLAFSVHQGKQEQDKYWFATANGNTRGSILSTSKLVNGSKWMEIQHMDLGGNVFAFKVMNAGDDMYLVARDNKEVHIEKAAGGKVPEGAKFKTVSALTTAKNANANDFRSFESVKFGGHFLRHAGYVLFVHPNDNSELFKQDASWLIEKM